MELLEESNLFPAVPDKEELDYNLLGHATIIIYYCPNIYVNYLCMYV